MYIPKVFAQKDLMQQHAIMQNYSFASLITHYQGEIQISHVPTILDKEVGRYGRLAWHIAKVNPHADILAKVDEVLCIFQGPHYYISPVWYGKLPNVPTWNYAVVHAYGKAKLITQRELSTDLTQLVANNEIPLHGADAYQVPDTSKATLLDHIRGFRMEISRLEAKFKLSQNKNSGVQEGVIQGLLQQASPEAKALADLMQSIKK